MRRDTASKDARQLFLEGGREADEFYRQRHYHDKVVRSTHGVDYTGPCSWEVYVKDDVITWKSQATDYPSTGPNMPDHEPRGCLRGAAFSWYEYSPTRIKYPYVHGVLVDVFHEAKARLDDPALARGSIVSDPKKTKAYKSQRDRGGMVRVSWKEAIEIMASAYVWTVKIWGPDHCVGFTVIPAMSIVSYGTGARFHQLIGGTMLSLYDWYADLPLASPQVFGDQIDISEASDWYNAQYLIMQGTNLLLTRTPDAHFMTEARYHSQKVIVVSPDYTENTKFSDEWLRVHPGTDAALAEGMTHVAFKEFYVDRREKFFADYVTRYSDCPFPVSLGEIEEKALGGVVGVEGLISSYAPGKFLTASMMPEGTTERSEHNEHRPLVIETDSTVKDPGRTLADHYGEERAGKWNLKLEGVEPVLSMMDTNEWEPVEVLLNRFDLPSSQGTESAGAGAMRRGVPARRIDGRLVTTIFDLMLAQHAVEREGLPGQWPSGYNDPSCPATPVWQETITGVPAAACEKIGRGFALSALASGGHSMILMGTGMNHYFHPGLMYRGFFALTTICACEGRNGGGWTHYVGQEKVRPVTGWQQYTPALDWQRSPRQMVSTDWYYVTTSQWRYDGARADAMARPLGAGKLEDMTVADTLVEAVQRGWMPSFPAYDRSPPELGHQAKEAGITPTDYVAQEFNEGRLKFAVTDPDSPKSFPCILANWRTNLLGFSMKGTEFFLKHTFGAENSVNVEELPEGSCPHPIEWRNEAAKGKLDLMWVADPRNTSTTLHSDIALPAATWYEKEDLSSTDMHPYVHSFNAAIKPPWGARTGFEIYRFLAKVFFHFTKDHLGTQLDVMSIPPFHDTPGEYILKNGVVPERKGWHPGVDMSKAVPIERDYTVIGTKFERLGPLAKRAGLIQKGVSFDPSIEVDKLGDLNGRAHMDGLSGEDSALLDSVVKAADMILMFSGTMNGRLAYTGFKNLERCTGTKMAQLAEGGEEEHITFADTTVQPRSVITSPEWTGSETGGRRYLAFCQNTGQSHPWHTLTGRPQFYADHDWIQNLGESLPVFRPPFDVAYMYGKKPIGHVGTSQEGTAEVAVHYPTIHNKRSIHSQYFDNPYMLTLSRAGQIIWMSPQDAEKIDVKNNEWVEAYNCNGIVSARAVVSHRIPEGTMLMHHAQERMAGTSLTERIGKRGGIHSSLTRIAIKPTHVAGGYGQISFAFNYYGPTGNQRDEVTVIRRHNQEVQY